MPSEQPNKKPEATYDWWVFSTAIRDVVLMLECRNTGTFGIVRNPTKKEWAAAFHAPSKPYRWTDLERVEIVSRQPEAPAMTAAERHQLIAQLRADLLKKRQHDA